MTERVTTERPITAPQITDLPLPERSTYDAMLRGGKLRCPNCGTGKLFSSYLVVADSCSDCGTALHHQRADDAPAYFTMFIVGHVVVGLALTVEQTFAPDLWVHAALWLPLLLAMSLWMLPRIKGALIGIQWAQRMHGFGGEAADGRDATTGVRHVDTAARH
jgi:uncharacterized protein (DUF983 family)